MHSLERAGPGWKSWFKKKKERKKRKEEKRAEHTHARARTHTPRDNTKQNNNDNNNNNSNSNELEGIIGEGGNAELRVRTQTAVINRFLSLTLCGLCGQRMYFA